jgi:hypothetical protein
LGYVIKYKKGKNNKVVDALSRRFEDLPEDVFLSLSLISFPTPTWVEELKSSYLDDSITKEILYQLQQGQGFPKGYTLQKWLILCKGRLYIVKDSDFKLKVLEYIHSNPTAGHSGYHKIVQRAKAYFFFGRGCENILKHWSGSVQCAKRTRVNLFTLHAYFSHYQFHNRYGLISLWIL